MAITKTSPAKAAAARQASVLEKEAPSFRKSEPSATKKTSDLPAAAMGEPGIVGTNAPIPGEDLAASGSILEEQIISPELRLQMIRDAAYFRAERRGFIGGDPMQDWTEAEAEVDRMLEEKLGSVQIWE